MLNEAGYPNPKQPGSKGAAIVVLLTFLTSSIFSPLFSLNLQNEGIEGALVGAASGAEKAANSACSNCSKDYSTGYISCIFIGDGMLLVAGGLTALRGKLSLAGKAETVEEGAVSRKAGAAGVSTEAGTAKYNYDAKTGQYLNVETRKIVDAGKLPWPKYPGFSETPVNTNLRPGKIIHRFGSLKGEFAGNPGTSISERGLPPGSDQRPYTRLRVLKPITVPSGKSAGVPEFGANGGGTQYLFDGGHLGVIPK